MSSRKFSTGHISKSMSLKKAHKNIKDTILLKELNLLPKLLFGESELLSEFGIKHRTFGRCLTKTHLGRYSVCYDIYINRKESLNKFYKDIGYSLDRKQNKLLNLIRVENAT